MVVSIHYLSRIFEVSRRRVRRRGRRRRGSYGIRPVLLVVAAAAVVVVFFATGHGASVSVPFMRSCIWSILGAGHDVTTPYIIALCDLLELCKDISSNSGGYGGGDKRTRESG